MRSANMLWRLSFFSVLITHWTSAATTSAADRPNIICILADDLGLPALGLHRRCL